MEEAEHETLIEKPKGKDTSAMGRNCAGSDMDAKINFSLYHYEYRTERWKGYHFNYDIYGYNENSKFVYGNVDIIDTAKGFGTR